jgi:hypothetical protein
MNQEAVVAVQTDEEVYLADSLEVSEANGSGVKALEAFIAENSDVIVESPRLPGVEMPYGALMAMCAATVTEQNAHKFLAESLPLVAAGKAKAERLRAEEEDAVTEDEVESKEDTAKQTAGVEVPKKNADASMKKQEPKVEESKAANVITEETQAPDATHAVSGGSLPGAANVPQPARATAAISMPEAQNSKSSDVVEATANSDGDHLVEPITHESAKIESKEVSAPAINVVEIPDAVSNLAENAPQPVAAREELVEATVSAKQIIELDAEAAESLQTEEPYQALASEIYAETEMEADEEPEAEGDPYQLLTSDGQWVVPESFGRFEMFEDSTNEDAPMESQAYGQESPEFMTELGMPAEEVEESIMLIADSIEQMEPEEAETAHEILDEIVQRIAEAQTLAEVDDAEDQISAAETEDIEEKLEELFTQLLNYVEVRSTPELVQSFVKLALKGDLSDLIEKIEKEDEDAAHDRGTHEVIKQLLASVRKMKKSIVHAYILGKSALRLYSPDLFSVDLKSASLAA